MEPGPAIACSWEFDPSTWDGGAARTARREVLQARVELVEHIEPEAYVSASLLDPAIVVRKADEFVGGSQEDTAPLAHDDARFLTLRVSADDVPARGEVIDLAISGDRIRLFDLATGNSLGH